MGERTRVAAASPDAPPLNPERPTPRRWDAGRTLRSSLGVWLTIWAVVLVAVSYRRAADGAATADYYGLFWLGLLPPMLYLAARLLWPRLGPWRLTETAVLALLTWFPKFLRNPYGPAYHDEFAHVRAVGDLAGSGRLHTKNPLISIIGQYPGLHIVTWVIESVSGLPVWSAGELLVGLVHLAGVVAVFLIGRALLGSDRAGGVMAFVYFANPDVLYFDNQFAYESLGIVLMLSALALTVLASSSRRPKVRRTYQAGAALAGIGCVMTHHLSTLFLLVLATLVLVAVARAGRGRASLAPWLSLWVCVAAASVLWLSTAARGTLSYLAPYAGPAVRQLADQASGSANGRLLFSGSVAPPYERIASYLTPVLLALLVLYVAGRYWRLRPAWRRYPVQTALTVFGLLYFPAAIFILAPIGAEGARRSWGFSYIGIAFIVAAIVCTRPRRPLHRAPAAVSSERSAVVKTGRVAAALVAVACLVVGNVSAGLNDSYRFPGPYEFGSDARSTTPELVALAQRFGGLVGPQNIITDRFTGLAMVQYGKAFTAAPSSGFPAWDLLRSTADPSRTLARELTSSSYDYLVVDSRISVLLPLIGSYFQPNEPFADSPRSPFPTAALNRLGAVSWASKILQTDHYSVYRLHLEGLVAK